MRSAPPSLLPALADSTFVYDGGRAWNPERALDLAARHDAEHLVPQVRAELEEALAPVPKQWFGRRLPVLWTLFMAAREADARALTIWMSETAHLLGDLPHDIVAHAIDEAIRTSRHGFIPSVGEIRAIADPILVERNLHIQRLRAMEAALADLRASAARQERRQATQRAAQASR